MVSSHEGMDKNTWELLSRVGMEQDMGSHYIVGHDTVV